MIAELTTRQRMVSFYMSWFARLYASDDTGWHPQRTPDDKSISEQDAYFWFALEAIARELNLLREVELAKLVDK